MFQFFFNDLDKNYIYAVQTVSYNKISNANLTPLIFFPCKLLASYYQQKYFWCDLLQILMTSSHYFDNLKLSIHFLGKESKTLGIEAYHGKRLS